jgi:hypothetical protein
MWGEVDASIGHHRLYVRRMDEVDPVLVSQALDGSVDHRYLASMTATDADSSVRVIARTPCVDTVWSSCGDADALELEEHAIDRTTLDVVTVPMDTSALTEAFPKGKGYVRHDAAGNLWGCYTVDFGTGDADEVVCNVRPAGASEWPADPVVVTDHQRSAQDHPTLTVGEAGRYAFIDASSGVRRVAVRIDATDGTYIVPRLSPKDRRADLPVIVAADDALHVAYHRTIGGTTGPFSAVVHLYCPGGTFDDCGSQTDWRQTVLATDGAVNPSLAVAPSGAAHVAYEYRGDLMVATWCNAVSAWTFDSIDDDPGDEHIEDARPGIAVAPDGTVSVVYTKDLDTGRELRLASGLPRCR